jgi:hypothetical protein
VTKLLLALSVAAAVSLLAAGRASATPIWAGQCGMPAAPTVWGEYGWPTLLPVFGKPGVALAVTSGTVYPQQARADGAATYYFDLHMNKRVGTPTKPGDAATALAQAEKAYAFAVTETGGCKTPVMIENELTGAGLVTPWTANNAQYRADVLAFLQRLAALGAHPVLLVNSTPFTGGDALDWWLQVSKVADIVREAYVPATRVWSKGPLLGNRLLRQRYRSAVADFTSIGIAPNRLGVMISFSAAKAGGGRSGLQPASAWYQVVKWEALAARTVAADTGLGSVWSWGWQMWNATETDPDKENAACVWLWARSSSLCDAPATLGPSFDASLTEGQIDLAPGVFCSIAGGGSITVDQLRALQTMTGDRDAAMSALFERLVESQAEPVTTAAILAAEKTVIADSFAGSRSAYVAALRAAHATVAVARAAIGDELRQAALEEALPAAAPTATDVQTFYSSYPQLLVRRVKLARPAPWLGDRKTGIALSEVAPAQVFTLPTGKQAVVDTLAGTVAVTPLAEPLELGALELATARTAITAALHGFAQGKAFERWTIARQNGALSTATCLRDDLPQPAAIDLADYLPFLRIG